MPLVVLGCSAAEPPQVAADAFAQALKLSAGGNTDQGLAALRQALDQDGAAVQRALLQAEFERNGWRDQPAFRSMLHESAVRHGISRVTLAREDEPGEWIEVAGQLLDADGRFVSGGVVQLYATDEKGLYHPTIEGDSVPRLFGTVVSDEQGRFSFRTVRPGAYPGTRDARHVHIRARKGDLRQAAPGYVVFDDDPLLEEPQNAEQRSEAVQIRMRLENGRFLGELVLPMR